MSIYWVYFDLPKNRGEMRLSIHSETKEAANKIAKDEAKKMSTEWAHRVTHCVR